MTIEIKHIALIGSGRAAQALLGRFRKDYRTTIYSRNPEKAALKMRADHVLSIDTIDRLDADLVFLCVPDDHIVEISKKIKHESAIVAHLSGSRGLDILIQENRAVFWPIQSLKDDTTSFEKVPIYFESNSDQIDQILQGLILQLKALPMNSSLEERHKMHLSAVVTNNFMNYMLSWSEEIVGRDAALNLSPILRDTITNWQKHKAKELQTGPAIRNDKETIKRHLDLLHENKEQQELYQLMTDLIKKTQ